MNDLTLTPSRGTLTRRGFASLALGSAAVLAVGQTAQAAPGDLVQGSSGAAVTALQKRLNQLGFWVGPADGGFGGQTRQGVLAAQKAGGLLPDGVVGAVTRAALSRGISLKPRSTSGHVLEVDRKRQLILVADGGKVTRYYNTSTGGNYTYYNPGSGRTESAQTPAGKFKVSRRVEGWDPGYLGAIYRPFYFNGGVAFHGTNSDVKATPLSHGCVRLTLPMMDEFIRSGQVKIGASVWVY